MPRDPGLTGPSWFHTTAWSMVVGAAKGGEADVTRLVRLYRRPIVRFLESRLPKGEDPEAIANDVLMTVLDPQFLAKADQAKGRFRQLILAVTRYTLNNALRKATRQKRGGGAAPVSLDELTSHPPSPEDEDGFTKDWAVEMLSQAMKRFKVACEEKGKSEYDAVRLRDLEGLSVEEIAKRLDKKETHVTTLIHRGRLALREHILETIRGYCSTQEEYDEEVKTLLAQVGGA